VTKTPNVSPPGTLTRDEDGLVFDSHQPLPGAQENLWVVAVDGSENALRATACAASQSSQTEACALHLIYVEHWLSKEAAEVELASRAWQATATARGVLDAAGQPWQLHVAMGEPAEKIIALAEELGASRIVVGNRGLSVAESLLCGSVTHKIVQQSQLPVLVVP
jgi:nucleotide-binding universal stress UspA family protein